MTTYITSTETAKLIRKALKESFPGVKFSVRTSKYSGGSSINVSWTDGPNSAQVNAITEKFEGSYFDGMSDYKGNNYHMMDGKAVSFGADFIFTDRNYSDKLILNAINAAYSTYRNNYEAANIAKPTIEEYKNGSLWNAIDPLRHHHGGQSVQNDITEKLSKRSSFVTANKSKTIEKLFFTGDDGYGYNATGKGANLKLVASNA